MMERTADPLLLPQIKMILQRKGYTPVVGDLGLYAPQNKMSLSAAFYNVTQTEVQKVGVMPQPKPDSHAGFIAKNARYLFN